MRLIFSICLTVFTASCLTAQDCAPGWAYVRSTTLDIASAPVTNFQLAVGLRVDDLLAEGKIRPDFGDVRAYVPESCFNLRAYVLPAPSGDSITIWLDFHQTDGPQSLEVNIYYGNPAAEPEFTDVFFPFLDDFSTGAIDPAKWEAVGEFDRFEVVDGIANYASTGLASGSRFKFARTAQAFTEDLTLEYRGAVTNSNGFGYSSSDVLLDRYLFRQSGFGFDTINQVAVMRDTTDNGIALENNYPIIRVPRSEFNTIRHRVGLDTAGNLRLTEFTNLDNGSSNMEDKVLPQHTMSGYHFIMSSFSTFGAIQLDYLLAYRELPLVTPLQLGEEQLTAPSGVTPLLTDSDVLIYPNPATTQVVVELPLEEPYVVEFFDALGRRQAATTATDEGSGRVVVNTADLPRGLYQLRLVRVRDGRYLQTGKVVVQR